MVVMDMRWEGVTPEQYDAAKRNVGWVQNPNPAGAVHLVWFENGALRCVDVWESEAAFMDFVETRLTPGLEGTGIQGQPEVRFFPTHDTFVLDFAHDGLEKRFAKA